MGGRGMAVPGPMVDAFGTVHKQPREYNHLDHKNYSTKGTSSATAKAGFPLLPSPKVANARNVCPPWIVWSFPSFFGVILAAASRTPGTGSSFPLPAPARLLALPRRPLFCAPRSIPAEVLAIARRNLPPAVARHAKMLLLFAVASPG